MKKILASLAFCVLATTIFIVVAAASKRELPAGLRDIYGDTSGIHQLSLEGVVSNFEGRYAYTFYIEPDDARISMQVFRNSQARANFIIIHSSLHFSDWHWRNRNFIQMAFTPIAPYRHATVESDHSFFHSGGGIVPFTEYRIYADIFAVDLLHHWHPLYFPCEMDGRLYIDAGPDGYIYAFEQNSRTWDIANQQPSQTSWRIPLVEQVQVGDASMFIFVPTGPGLFGHTAVYTVDWHDAPMVQQYYADGATIYNMLQVARVLYPIELEKGQDEILGLLELDEECVLLVIQREEGFQFTRINHITGESSTIFAEGVYDLIDMFHRDNSLVFRVFGRGAQEYSPHATNVSEILALDLSGGGVVLAAHFHTALEGRIETEIISTNVYDIVLRDSTVYIAYTVVYSPWTTLWANEEAFISAFDATGQLIGISQIMTGAEDDFARIWERRLFSRSGGILPSRYRRHIQSLSIR